MAKQNGNSGGKFFIGAAIGAAVGAITALLTAPKSGKETRADIKSKATEMSHEALRQLRKLEGELNKRISDVKRLSHKLQGDARKEVDDLVARAEKMKERASKIASDMKDDVQKQLDDKFIDDIKTVLSDLQDLAKRIDDRKPTKK